MSAEAGDGHDPAVEAHIRACRTYMRQGAAGLDLLKKKVRASYRAHWVRQIPLGDAIKGDSFLCLKYLVDHVEVETLNGDNSGYTPLQLAVIWGKIETMAYLLSKGAEPLLGHEKSVVNTARLRQQRLNDALENSGDGSEFEGFTITTSRIKPLIQEGLDMLEILEGMDAAGSYVAWAEKNMGHPLVRRFSGNLNCSEPRYQFAMLRALLKSTRASLRSTADRGALEAEQAASAAAKAKEEQPLQEALVDEGFKADSAKELRDLFRAPTLKALRSQEITEEEVEKKLEPSVRTRRMTEGEKRKFIRFVREIDEIIEKAAKKAAPKPEAKSAGGYSAAKAKAKAPAAAAKAALLAMAAKGASKGAAAKSAPAKPKQVQIDAMEMMFSTALPDNAFAVMTQCLFGA